MLQVRNKGFSTLIYAYSVRISHSDREFQLRAKDEQTAKEWVKEMKNHIQEANRLRAGEGSSTDLVKDTKFWKVKVWDLIAVV